MTGLKLRGLTFGRALLLVWIIACAILVCVAWSAIMGRAIPDSDDHMRLQQVRDLLAGQSWFDTNQHRMNPPEGAPMHWSRLVDIPLALTILLLRPLLGAGAAELATMTIVPLVTLAAAMWLTALLARRFVGEVYSLVGAALLPGIGLVWVQIHPLRIDHHGWQLVAALAAALAVFQHGQRRSGIAAGAAMALWLSISIEGLPFAATIGALLAIRWALASGEGARIEAYLWTLALLSGLLPVATAPPASWTGIHCDSLTLPYVAAFASAAAVVSIARRLPLGRWARFAALALAGAAAAAALGSLAPACLNGPFAELDPLVRTEWYLRVPEGLPLWWQNRSVAAMVIGFPLVGLACTFRAWRRAPIEERRDWASLLILLSGAMCIAVMLQRAGALANVLALPGALHALSRLLPAARRIEATAPRIAATVAVVLLLSPWTVSLMALLEPEPSPAEKRIAVRQAVGEECGAYSNVAKLNALPPADLLTPLDIAPPILTATRHRVVASSHHRNQAAMHDVIAAFLGSTENARRIIEARGIDYVVVCPYMTEPLNFAREAPQGFWARIGGGRAPSWLEPVQLADMHTMAVWRVRR